MLPTNSDRQQLARLVRFTVSKLRMQVTSGFLVFGIITGILGNSFQDHPSPFPLIIVVFGALALASGWTTYVLSSLARVVIQQQQTILQLQRDLAALRENRS